MAKTGDDCYFFYNQTCIKGETCPFRHVEEARSSTVTCDKWRMNVCNAIPCLLRHMELQQNVPCFYETQPGGCTRPNCQFRHKFSKQQAAPPAPVPISVAPVPGRIIQPQPPVSGPVPVIYNRPPPPRPGWQGAGIPAGQMFPGPPVSRPPRPLPPGYHPFPPAASIPPVCVPVMQVEPVIINPNEESDQDSIKGSPMKAITRVQPAVPPQTQAQSSNPLDYFLNAKPYVDTSQRNVFKRSPSPVPRRSRSRSPRRSVSPRRSQSPTLVRRQRSLSAERYSSGARRRSGSLDRSRSPEWRDSRRFGRRSSRSPPRRRSRSPNRDRDRGILNRFRQGGRGRKLEEVKVTGSKIISIKKDKKSGKEDEEVEKEKGEEKVDKVKAERSKVSSADVVKEEVKSLEDIYRERALQSMMEAKRKKILENKRKRWENVEPKKVSESEKSDKSGKQSENDEDQSNVDEKGDNKNEDVDSSCDSADETGDNKSDNDLPDDIDIELGEGELESDNESGKSEEVTSDKESDHKEESSVKQRSKPKGSVSVPAKPSVKSRLGHKVVNTNSERNMQENTRAITQKRSVKDRLGIKDRLGVKINRDNENSVQLNKSSRVSSILSRLHPDKKDRKSKNVLMLPQITIKNESDIDSRKADIFQRLGLNDDEEFDSDSKKEKKKKKSIDEELMKLLREEDSEIDEDDLELLSKKEKKKLLKKLLAQQGREEEYDWWKKKKKKGFKKKREHKELDEERESKRKINVQIGKDEEEGEAELEDLQSEDEILLDDDTTELEPAEEPVKEERIVKSSEDIQREKEEKKTKLREALEPKSLEDIRRERALKKSQPGDARIKIGLSQNKRKIVLEDQQPKVVEPPVRITFHGVESAPKRKLIRLGKEQIENNQPGDVKAGRGIKRERQIYIPPTVKRTAPEEPVVKVAGPPKGREIVHYGDMFSKKPTPVVEEKKMTVKLTKSASESVIRPRLQLNRGPPKVEVKDATVKTFAEIMAEKKRKRLLAQQGKSYTPITFDEESSQGSIQTDDDRLSPIPSQSSVSSSSINSPVKTSPLKSVSRQPSVSNTEKTETKTRWKRRKLSNPDIPTTEKSIAETQENKFDVKKDSKVSSESDVLVEKKSKNVDESVFDEEFTSNTSSSLLKVKPTITSEESKKRTEEKKSVSESFMDFDDDLLNMDDDDVDIDLNLEGGGKDTDELMREIDEMLA